MFLDAVLRQIIGSKNDRELRKLTPRVVAINALESSVQGLTDDQLRDRTGEFRRKIEAGATMDDILHEAFAVVREAGRRVLGMRHFDVQLIGGMVLHQGKIAEMKTGEGKTLVATLPVYLNGLVGRGVHVVTVNDYLARRDSEWMGRLYRFLGLTVGVIQHDLDDAERQAAYGADVTYGTNNEFGFDYLRDNMKYSLDAFVQRGHHYAIVDEVDSILIDEARTPLIISGPSEESVDKYYEVDRIIPRLRREEDFKVDEKARTVNLTEEGVEKVEKLLGVHNLYDPEAMEMHHCIQQALKAHVLFKLDVDYMVKDGEVLIVDEFTGRLMPGRRWSDGLHQAVEAKEKVKIEKENQTLATITFQNYFRMYEKLAGMTGTADTEAVEFDKIYKLDVMVIPTNRPLIRLENPDVIYRTEEEKFRAVVRGDRGAPREGAAGAGGHGLHREVGAPCRDAEEEGRPPRRPQRQVPREGGGDRGPGRAPGLRHHRHQHGGTRDRHPPGRQSRVPGPEGGGRAGAGRPRGRGSRLREVAGGVPDPLRRGARPGGGPGRPPHPGHRAPRGPPHRQPAPRPGRPPGGSRVLAVLPVPGGRPDAHLRLRPDQGDDAQARDGGGRSHRALDGDAVHRAGPEAGGGPELRHPQAPPGIRRRDEQAADGDLPASAGAAGGQGAAGVPGPEDGGDPELDPGRPTPRRRWSRRSGPCRSSRPR